MRTVKYFVIVVLIAGCVHDKTLDDSWSESKKSTCDRLAGESWQKLETPPVNAEALLSMVLDSERPKNLLWYQGTENSFMLCVRRLTTGCSNQPNGISVRATSAYTYAFTLQNEQWVVKEGNFQERICVSGG